MNAVNLSKNENIANVIRKNEKKADRAEKEERTKKEIPEKEIPEKEEREERVGHGHSHHEGSSHKTVRFALGAVLFAVCLILRLNSKVEIILFSASYLLVGYDVIKNVAANIFRGRFFDENSLMFIATIGAFSIGEFSEGVAVMLFYEAGEMLQERAVNHSRKSIKSLLDIRPDYANLKTNGSILKVSPYDVKIGDIILVKPGERVPLDGTVVDGKSFIDTSALTGESVPREVDAGDEILSGSINKNGVLHVRVDKEYGDSTASKILEMVENAESQKAKTESFITRFSVYYTPAVVLGAMLIALIPPLVLPGQHFSDWLYRALVFLVISCPCALVLSIPLSYFGGIGRASKAGVLVKGGNYLEALNNISTMVFDKTGTITKGVFKVAKIHSEGRFSEGEMLEYAAMAEAYSDHPIAEAILSAYDRPVDNKRIEKYEEIPGLGVKAKIDGTDLVAGNIKLLYAENIICDEADEYGTIVYIGIDGVYAGHIVISDEVKEEVPHMARDLRELGVRKLVILTGDRPGAAKKIGLEMGFDEVFENLLPHEKVEKLESIAGGLKSGKLAFVGDGINDAPVLARADIGIAMGGLGSDAAIEAADVVLMTDELSKIAHGVRIARQTHRIAWQNIALALAIKIIILLLGANGMASMWEAVFADVGVAMLTVLNSMRILNMNV